MSEKNISDFSANLEVKELLDSDKSIAEVEKESRDIISEKLHNYYLNELTSELYADKDPVAETESIDTSQLTKEKISDNLIKLREKIANESDLDFVYQLHKIYPHGKFYLVGGYVRDGLTGKKSKDLDLVIGGIPSDQLEKSLKKIGRVDLVGKNFGVYKFAKPKLEENQQSVLNFIDIALPRTEIAGGSGNKRDFQIKPDSQITIEEDLSRRDLTINAMAYDILDNKLIDPFDGKSDLSNKIIRTVNNPDDRFGEDLSRMLRVIRFAVKMGFEIDQDTWQSICKNIPGIIEKNINNEQIVPWETIGEELKKAFMLNPSRTLELLNKSNALEYILPEVKALINVEQPPEYHKEGDVYAHTKLVLKSLPPDSPISLVFAALLHDIGKPQTYDNDNGKITFYGHAEKSVEIAKEICARLRFTNKTTEKILLLISKHMGIFRAEEMKKIKLFNLLMQELPHELLRLNQADVKGSLSTDKKSYDFPVFRNATP